MGRADSPRRSCDVRGEATGPRPDRPLRPPTGRTSRQRTAGHRPACDRPTRHDAAGRGFVSASAIPASTITEIACATRVAASRTMGESRRLSHIQRRAAPCAQRAAQQSRCSISRVSHPRPPRSAGFGTRAISAATRAPKVDQEPDAVPIYQAVTFSAEDSAELGDILGDRKPGYSLLAHRQPNVRGDGRGPRRAARRRSGLRVRHGHGRGSRGCSWRCSEPVTTSSPLPRFTAASSTCSRTGFGRLGVETHVRRRHRPAAVEAAFRPNTRVLHVETIANPTIVVADLPALAEIAHRHGAALTVDNTFASPYLCRPLEQGADLVFESCTKWIGGHSDVLGGVVVGDAARIQRCSCGPDRHRRRPSRH